MPKRDESFWSIFNSVIRLEVQRGHLKWTMAELSRSSEVGRSSIYHYFGSSKEDILKKAIRTIGEEFYGLSEERLKLWGEGRIEESVIRSREMVTENPYLLLFFLTWRKNNHTEIQAEILTMETRYLDKLRQAFPGLSDRFVKGLFAVFYGLVSAPHMEPEDIPPAVRAAMSLVENKRASMMGGKTV